MMEGCGDQAPHPSPLRIGWFPSRIVKIKRGNELKIARLYAGSDGESHFDDIELPMQARKDGRKTRTEVLPARGIVFFDAGDSDFHRAPARQLVFVHEGQIEVIVGDGSSRVFKPGEVFLAEDLTGRGHKSLAKDLSLIIATLE